MNIEVKAGYEYTEIVFLDTNIRVEFNVSEGIYSESDGSRTRVGHDITDEGLNSLVKPLEDLIYYRKRDFDSVDLIKQLFDKLSEKNVQEVLKELNDSYGA